MALPLVPLIGAVQAITGLFKGNKAAADAKRLRASRKAFQTSDEVYDIVNQTENKAQTGFDPATMQYLDTQIDNTTAAGLGTAARLGANPNDLSAILDQSLMASMKVGADNATMQMENFSKYLGAEQLLANNLDAEWASQQGMIKDDLQAAGQARQEATAQIGAGISNTIAGISAIETEKLYKERTDAIKKGGVLDAGGALQAIQPVTPTTIPAVAPAATTTTTIPSQLPNSSVSALVTPTQRPRSRVMGVDSSGNLIYNNQPYTGNF